MHPRRSLLTALVGGLGGGLLGGVACSSTSGSSEALPAEHPGELSDAANVDAHPGAARDGEHADEGDSGEAGTSDAMLADGGVEEANSTDAPGDAPPCETSVVESPPCQAASPGVQVGPVQNFLGFGLHPFLAEELSESLLLGRDCGGLYALSAVCPHMGCPLALQEQISDEGVACGCHGSTFDLIGRVTRGPAKKNLVPLAVMLGCDGLLYVDRTTPVDREQRLVVKEGI